MKRKTAYLGMFAALAVILGYVESLFPVFFGIPGVKLGLANMAVIAVLYFYGYFEALGVSLVRILVIGALFGNLYSMVYSLAGAVVSLTGMALLKRCRIFSIYGVSACGGVLHNLAQLLIAAMIVQTFRLWYYGPVLICSGVLTGIVIGLLGAILTKRLEGVRNS